MHFSSYSLLNISLLFDFIFQKFARQQSIFPDFSKPALEHAFLPVTSPNKHLEPVTLHKTELVWAGFLHLFSEAEGSVVCVHVTLDRRSMSPTWRQHPSCEALRLTEAYQSGSHPTVCEQGFENLMWPPRMEPPAGCFTVLLLRDLLSVLFSYLVNLLDGGIFYFFQS